MHRSQAAPPGARIPLLVLVVALAAGAVLFFRLHRGDRAAEGAARARVASPARPGHDARTR